MTATNHPWCSNTARDEAIRAAEDAAAAERTPLPDHRDLPQAVHDLRRRVEGLETVADHWRRQCEADAENREAAVVSREGVNADGLRTERVTLEITHGSVVGAAGWSWGTIIRVKPGESVRVVWGGGEERPNDLGILCTASELADRCTELARRLVNQGDEVSRLTAERDAAIRERDAAQSEAAGIRNRLEAESAPGLRSLANNLRDKLRDCESALKRTEARVAELESSAKLAPAANAGVVSNPEPISGGGKPNCQGKLDSSQEPVAWGVKWDGKAEIDGEFLYTQKEFAHEVLANNYGRGTVVPLYAAPVAESATTPQPPRGWLTKEERRAVEAAVAVLDQRGRTNIGVALDALLARLTPPRVKVPHLDDLESDERPMWESACMAWIAAIREAGGEVE